jgi:hypothetical protein
MGACGLVLAVNMLWAAGLMKLLSREAKEFRGNTGKSMGDTVSLLSYLYGKGLGDQFDFRVNIRTSRRFCHYLRSGPNRTK